MIIRAWILLAVSAVAVAQQQQPATTAEDWQKLGLARHLENKFDESIPAFTAAIKLNPALWTSHLFLGIGRYRTNRFAEAIDALTRADRLGPATGQGRDEIDYWLGAARIAGGQTLGGLRSVEKLLARNPKHADGLQLATVTYAAASAQLWNGVAERHFNSAAGQHVHGLVLESEGDTANALDAYRQARALDPKRPGPSGAIGRLLLAGREPAKALAALESELAIAPRDGEASQYAGLALVQLGRHAEAAVRFEAAAKAMPRNPEPLMALAQVRLALGQPKGAVEAAGAAVKLAPDMAAARELLAAAMSAAAGETAPKRP